MPSLRLVAGWPEGAGVTFYMWLGADAEAAAIDEETRLRLIVELPSVDDTGEDG